MGGYFRGNPLKYVRTDSRTHRHHFLMKMMADAEASGFDAANFCH